jgi:hypothetical protein
MASRISQLKELRKQQAPLPFGAEIIFDHGIVKGTAEVQWVEDVLRQLQERQERTLDE